MIPAELSHVGRQANAANDFATERGGASAFWFCVHSLECSVELCFDVVHDVTIPNSLSRAVARFSQHARQSRVAVPCQNVFPPQFFPVCIQISLPQSAHGVPLQFLHFMASLRCGEESRLTFSDSNDFAESSAVRSLDILPCPLASREH